jgi:protein MAK16
MQHDDMLWTIFGGQHQHCAHKFKPASEVNKVRTFCRHPYNVTGECNRTSCPLANSQYATVREEGEQIFLYMKVVERSAFPKKLWERVELSKDLKESLNLIRRHLMWWNPYQVNHVKRRFIRLRQVIARKKKLAKKEAEVHLDPLKKKHEKREKKREFKALIASKMEKTVERELKTRLKKGVYGNLYDFMTKMREEGEEEEEEESERESERESEMESELEEEIESMELDGKIEIVEDETIEESEDEIEDLHLKRKLPVSKKRARREMEYETEKEPIKKPVRSKIKINTS